MSSSKGSRDGIFGSVYNRVSSSHAKHVFQHNKTYGFLLVSLDNREVLRIMHTLHHKPRNGLLILGVDTGSFDQLVLELRDGGLARVLGTKVNLY